MHMRFRCANLKDGCSSGFLGQSRNHPADAIGILEATLAIFKRFCTRYANAPTSHLAAEFREELFQHMLHIFEAISIDSAEAEVVSAKDINRIRQGSPDILVLRDGAHCARRLLSRLFEADPVIKATFDYFSVLPHLEHWSQDLRTLYQECTDQTAETSAVRTRFRNLRGAKHRIETMLSPMSRQILDPDGEH